MLRPLGVVETKFMSLSIRREAPPTTERTGSVKSSTERFGDGVRIARSDRKKKKITSLRKRTTEILIDFCTPCGGGGLLYAVPIASANAGFVIPKDLS